MKAKSPKIVSLDHVKIYAEELIHQLQIHQIDKNSAIDSLTSSDSEKITIRQIMYKLD